MAFGDAINYIKNAHLCSSFWADHSGNLASPTLGRAIELRRYGFSLSCNSYKRGTLQGTYLTIWLWWKPA